MDSLETAFSTDLRAQQVFTTICNALDHLGLNRHTDTNSDGSCTAHAGVISDEFRLRLIFTVRHQIDCITLIVALPFTAPIPRRMWAAAAVCAVNLKLFEGLFEYNMEDGSIFFRMTENYLMHRSASSRSAQCAIRQRILLTNTASSCGGSARVS